MTEARDNRYARGVRVRNADVTSGRCTLKKLL
jgi:hypothetical protein